MNNYYPIPRKRAKIPGSNWIVSATWGKCKTCRGTSQIKGRAKEKGQIKDCPKCIGLGFPSGNRPL